MAKFVRLADSTVVTYPRYINTDTVASFSVLQNGSVFVIEAQGSSAGRLLGSWSSADEALAALERIVDLEDLTVLPQA